MEIHAFDKLYLDDAMSNLGEAFDYAINDCHLDPDEFMKLFIVSGLSKQYEIGNPKYIVGMSGIELVMEVLTKSKRLVDFPEHKVRYDYSKEYWAGWILEYYEWKTSKSFKRIHSIISIKEIIDMYYPLHEAHEDKFVDTLNAIYEQNKENSYLQKQRKIRGISQKELSDMSGVNLRTLQQYETRSKDINKASVSVVLSIARVLGCEIEDILE